MKSAEPASQQPTKQTRLETTRPPAQEEEQRSEKKVEFTEGGQAIEVGQPEPSEFLTSPDDAGALSEISRETFDRIVETETTDLMGSPSAPDVKAPIGSRSETKTPSASVQADVSPRALEAPRKPENVDRDGGSTAEPFAERDVESLDPGRLQSKTLSDADEVIDLTEPEAEIEVEVEAGGADVQDRPLHEVWPVKETAQTPKRTVSTETAVEPAKLMPADDKGDQPTLIISAPELDEGTKEDELSTALRNVSPGQPTESSIELLPPRRPRPAIAPAPNQQRADSELLEKSPSESPVEEQEISGIKQLETIDRTETRSFEAPPLPLPRDEESTPSQPPAQEAIEQQTSFSPPTEPDTSEGKGPEMVQTGVGSLPRDFWEYLGEEAPEPSTPPPTPTPPSSPLSLSTAPETQSQSRQKPAVMSAPAALQTAIRTPRSALPEETLSRGETRSETSTPILDFQTPLQPTGLESVLDWVQRQDGSSTTSDAGGSEDSQDQDDGSGTAELNIEELARQILPIIKRKLSIEWERNRGRF
jgi:hypothetical protein